jgi:hypothetical protein
MKLKLTTITLAIALALPSTFALARGGMHGGSHVSSFGGATAGVGRIASKPRNISGNSLAPIAHDPSGSTINGAAMKRSGG